MYYEARPLTSRPVESAHQAAELIKTHQASTHEALIWTATDGRRFAAVDDSHIDGAWMETAVICLDTMIQHESITTGWCDTVEEVASHFHEAQDTAFYGKTTLALDGDGEDATVTFTCSCCGESFRSTIAKQKPLDQDHGHGHCEPCEA